MTDIRVMPIRLEYNFSPGLASSEFGNAILEGRLVGRRCGTCKKTYVPARLGCPQCGVPMDQVVEVKDTGVVTMFCVVNIPFAGQAVECPYVSASVRLDGADDSIFHLIQEIPAYDVRVGMRVKAVWVPREERQASLLAIKYFAPTSEPDA